MNQREYERSIEAVRRRNRRRRMARQRKRRRQQMIRLGIAGFFCCMLCICGFALHGMLAPKPPEQPAETEQQSQNSQTAPEETPTPQETPLQETQETQEPEEPAVPVDPESVIYLTFDDGPSNTSTEEILDILKKNNVHATFFIVNYSADKIPLLQRMVDEGHTIGIHAYDHDYKACYSTDEAYPEGVVKLMEKLQQDVNYTPYCLRFPGGSSNTISRKYNEGVMTRLAAKIESMGLEYYDWNVDSGDAAGNHIEASTLSSNAIGEMVKGKHNIVLMHDTDAKDTTVQALQAIIDYGKENGYHFEGIGRDTPPVHHQINN